MEKSPYSAGLKCLNGNSASSLCGTPTCPGNSVICDLDELECNCSISHQDCLTVLPLNRVKKNLNRKGRSSLPIVAQIREWYNKQIKLLNIELQMFQKLVNGDDQNVVLEGQEEKLYLLMREGEAEGMSSKLVAEVLSSIQKQPEYDISEKMGELKALLLKSEEEMKVTMDSIRKFVQVNPNAPITTNSNPNAFVNSSNLVTSLQKLPFYFSPTLHNEGIDIFQPAIKLKTQNEYSHLALIEPSLSSTCEINFQILSLKQNISFGICQKQETNEKKNQKNLFSEKFLQYQLLVGTQETLLWLRTQEGQEFNEQSEQSFNQMKFEKHNIVKLKYQKQNNKLIVKNINQSEVEYQIQTRSNQPLCFVVSLKHQGDSVEIVQSDKIQKKKGRPIAKKVVSRQSTVPMKKQY